MDNKKLLHDFYKKFLIHFQHFSELWLGGTLDHIKIKEYPYEITIEHKIFNDIENVINVMGMSSMLEDIEQGTGKFSIEIKEKKDGSLYKFIHSDQEHMILSFKDSVFLYFHFSLSEITFTIKGNKLYTYLSSDPVHSIEHINISGDKDESLNDVDYVTTFSSHVYNFNVKNLSTFNNLLKIEYPSSVFSVSDDKYYSNQHTRDTDLVELIKAYYDSMITVINQLNLHGYQNDDPLYSPPEFHVIFPTGIIDLHKVSNKHRNTWEIAAVTFPKVVFQVSYIHQIK